jgi:exopolyphosphatase/guanosine-5'-triphosphate,3'-diphosphate pyrophosphatase
MSFPTLAAVDLGSNSFHLEVGRVERDQIYPMDSWKETIRFGAGLDTSGNIRPEARTRALDTLARFGERLRGWSPAAVRAVATNTLRVARDGAAFLPQAERALGFPIEIVSGREEARLIYLGVSHSLPPSDDPRLVVDIGGGSTEFIVGRAFEAQRVESLKLGCVTLSLQYFPEGKIERAQMREAQLAAQAQVEEIASDFDASQWKDAFGSSGTARTLSEILEQNGWSADGITLDGLNRLREALLGAGSVEALLRLRLPALKPERAPVIPGGLVIMVAVLTELGVEHMRPAGGALRLGVLYDLLGRTQAHDTRATTVERFAQRYAIDKAQAARVARLADGLLVAATSEATTESRLHLRWAAHLHELGFAISHGDFHKHTAYILEHADMPGFSTRDQQRIALLALAQRGNLKKVRAEIDGAEFRAQVLALRVATLFSHARRPVELPAFQLACGSKIRLALPAAWLDAHPLTAYLLDQEGNVWRQAGIDWKLSHLDQ